MKQIKFESIPPGPQKTVDNAQRSCATGGLSHGCCSTNWTFHVMRNAKHYVCKEHGRVKAYIRISCSVCNKLANRLWCATHRENVNAMNNRWRQKNRERYNASRRAWWKLNGGFVNAKRRAERAERAELTAPRAQKGYV